MRVWVYMVCRDEEEILPYVLRHYNTFAERVIIYDAGSVDRSRDIAREYGAEIVDWDTNGELNSETDRALKSTCWSGCPADWAIVVDTDEFIYFPRGVQPTLSVHERQRTKVVKTRGFDMFSDVFPTTKGQIYEEVQYGAPAQYWYGKPALFSPQRILSLDVGHGAHALQGVGTDGERFNINPDYPPSDPPVYLLHYKHIGPLERIAENNRLKRSRLAAINVKMNWGNLEDPMKHAVDKRNGILAGIRKVII